MLCWLGWVEEKQWVLKKFELVLQKGSLKLTGPFEPIWKAMGL